MTIPILGRTSLRRTCFLLAAVGVLSSTAQAQSLAITGARLETMAKVGTLDSGTILIKDGKIEAVGKDVSIPVAARRLDASGKTILPGLVDPYYVVSIGRNTRATATRTIVFRGRTFVIGGGSPAIATTFARIADGLDLSEVDWKPARRSGLTTLHVVTGGYAQSLLARPQAENQLVTVTDDAGPVLVTVSNETKSLDVLRKNLKPPQSNSERRGSSSSSSSRPSSSGPSAGSSGGSRPAAGDSIEQLWADIRAGKSPVYINVNNASAILHVDAIVEEFPKVRVVLIASGQNVFRTLENLESKRYTVLLPPQIDTVPNSATRINVPGLLRERELPFAFSLSLGQSDFRTHQPTPLAGVAMLVRAGLDRQAALQALTIEPAKLLGLEKEIGSLEVGKLANLVVFDEDPLSATASIEQVFVAGQPLTSQSAPE